MQKHFSGKLPKSLDLLKVEIINRTSKAEDCWIWQSYTNNSKIPIIKSRSARRIMWIASFGEIPRNQIVFTKCLNPLCLNPDHLYIAISLSPPIEQRFWMFVEKSDGCWIWTGKRLKVGYGYVSQDSKKVGAHRFSYELHFGAIPKGIHICHHCDNRLCVRPSHLFAGTHQDNMTDRNTKGRQAKGHQMAHNAKLSDYAKEIRLRYASGGITQSQLAAEFNVNSSRISKLINRKTYRDDIFNPFLVEQITEKDDNK